MSNWNKISLFNFQQVEAISVRTDIPDIDKTLFSVCAVFDMTEYQLDNTDPVKAKRLVNNVTEIFSSEFNNKAAKRIGRYFVNYDPSKMTFGQYVELCFFLQEPIKKAHYTLASITNTWQRKNDTSKHSRKAEYFLKQPVEKVVGVISLFMERFRSFNNEYKSLFGLDKEVNGSDAQADIFNKRYGWIYSASQIAEYERITLSEAFALPVRQALNDLAYLKAKVKYETEQLKKK